jgi:hypothetical protein
VFEENEESCRCRLLPFYAMVSTNYIAPSVMDWHIESITFNSISRFLDGFISLFEMLIYVLEENCSKSFFMSEPFIADFVE